MITLLLLLAYNKISAMDDDQPVQTVITVQYADEENVEKYISISRSANKLSRTECARNKKTGKFDGTKKVDVPWSAIPGGDPRADPEAMMVFTSFFDSEKAENEFNKLKKACEKPKPAKDS